VSFYLCVYVVSEVICTFKSLSFYQSRKKGFVQMVDLSNWTLVVSPSSVVKNIYYCKKYSLLVTREIGGRT